MIKTKIKFLLSFLLGSSITASVIVPILISNRKNIDNNKVLGRPYVLDADAYKGYHKFSDNSIYDETSKKVEKKIEIVKLDKNKFIDSNFSSKYLSASIDDNFKISDNYYSKDDKNDIGISENQFIDFYNKETEILKNNFIIPTKYIEPLKNQEIDKNDLGIRKLFIDFYEKYVNPKTFKRIAINTLIKNKTKKPISHITLKLNSNRLSSNNLEDFSNVNPIVKEFLGEKLNIFKKNKDLPTKIISFNIKHKNYERYIPNDIIGLNDYKYIIKLKEELKPGDEINIKAKYISRLINYSRNNVGFILKNYFGISAPWSTFLNTKDQKIYDDVTVVNPTILAGGLPSWTNVKFKHSKNLHFAINRSFIDKINIPNNDKNFKINYYSYSTYRSMSFLSLRNKKLVSGVFKDGNINFEYNFLPWIDKKFKELQIFSKTSKISKEIEKLLNVDISKYHKNFSISSIANSSGGRYIFKNLVFNPSSLDELKSIWLHEYLHILFGEIAISFENQNEISFFTESITEFLTILYQGKLYDPNYKNNIYKSVSNAMLNAISNDYSKFWIKGKYIDFKSKKPILSSFKMDFKAKIWSNYKFGPLIHLEFFAKYKNKYLNVIKDLMQVAIIKKRPFNAYDFINSIGKWIGRVAQDRMFSLLMKPAKDITLDLDAMVKFIIDNYSKKIV